MGVLEVVAVAVEADGAESEETLERLLREIGRYVEWTVPELVPARAEVAERLMDVARFAVRLLIQPNIERHCNAAIVAAQLEQLRAVRARL